MRTQPAFASDGKADMVVSISRGRLMTLNRHPRGCRCTDGILNFHWPQFLELGRKLIDPIRDLAGLFRC